jgi:hypothetical protein
VSNLSFGSGVAVIASPQGHQPTSAPFRVGHQAYLASYAGQLE